MGARDSSAHQTEIDGNRPYGNNDPPVQCLLLLLLSNNPFVNGGIIVVILFSPHRKSLDGMERNVISWMLGVLLNNYCYCGGSVGVGGRSTTKTKISTAISAILLLSTIDTSLSSGTRRIVICNSSHVLTMSSLDARLSSSPPLLLSHHYHHLPIYPPPPPHNSFATAPPPYY